MRIIPDLLLNIVASILKTVHLIANYIQGTTKAYLNRLLKFKLVIVKMATVLLFRQLIRAAGTVKHQLIHLLYCSEMTALKPKRICL